MGSKDLRGCWAIRGGRIENGMIRILANGVSDNGRKHTGGRYYSDELLRYSYPIFSARIDGQGNLFVANQGRVIHEVAPESIFWVSDVSSYPVEVIEGGWLVRCDDDSWCYESLVKELVRVSRRETSHYRDNSPFYKVDEGLEGEIFLLIVNEWDRKSFRVVNPETKTIVPGEVVYPFARGVWLFDFDDDDIYPHI